MRRKEKITRFVAGALAFAMMATSAVSFMGCGKKEEEVVPEDVVTVIDINEEDLEAEITDEDLGIIRKDVEELYTIDGYQSWEGYNFLVLSNKTEENLVVQVENEELYNALFDARKKILIDAAYVSVGQDDEMYAMYAKGLRSLGSNFYSMNGEAVEDEPVETEPEVEETQESMPDQESSEEVTETTNESSEAEVTEAESAEVETAVEETTEEIAAEDFEDVQYQSFGDALSGGVQNQDVAVKVDENKFEESLALEKAIDEYMASVSLKRATSIVVYSLDGIQIGELTGAKVSDYASTIEDEVREYDSENGTMYLSDIEDGVQYKLIGKEDNGEYVYTIKNDINMPVAVSTYSESYSNEVYMFENYMTTEKSTGWSSEENVYSFTSTESEFTILVEIKNSDADLASYLTDEQVLTIGTVARNLQSFSSKYYAVVNDTEAPMTIVADTGDEMVLGSRQAIGIHKAAYDTLTLMFESQENDNTNQLLGNN